jgi:ribosomal protein L34
MKNLRETYPKPTISLKNQGLRNRMSSRTGRTISAQAIDFSGAAFFGQLKVIG